MTVVGDLFDVENLLPELIVGLGLALIVGLWTRAARNIIAAMLLAWMSEPWHGVATHMVALLALLAGLAWAVGTIYAKAVMPRRFFRNWIRDLLDALARLAPERIGYRHDVEGPDDMPAHIKSMLTATSLSIPVRGGRPVFGKWQALYLVEHRAQRRVR